MIIRPLVRGILDTWQFGAAAASFTPITATGGTITDTTIGGRAWRVHTFSTSGDFVVTDVGSDGGAARALGVGSGASGAHNTTSLNDCGGSAGGEVIDQSVTLTLGSFPIVIGAGAAAIASGVNSNGIAGSDTTGLGLTANGGGPGGTYNMPGSNADNAGGGGGGQNGTPNPAGGTGTRNGGNGFSGFNGGHAGGGGAGAGTAGGNASSGVAGAAGDGLQSDIDGTATYYGGATPGMSLAGPGATGLGGVTGVARSTAANNGVDGLGSAGTPTTGAFDSGKGGDGVFKVGYWLEAA